jgi:hypothetical protein
MKLGAPEIEAAPVKNEKKTGNMASNTTVSNCIKQDVRDELVLNMCYKM